MLPSDSSYSFSEATDEESNYIDDAIASFNAQQVPFTQKETPIFKRYVIKKENNIIAGINAIIYHWGILYIDVLFVADNERGNQLGSYLLKKVEEEAKNLGATLSHLDTFDFQAKDFYLKHGYKTFGTLDNCPPGHQRFYLKKTL